MEMNLRAIRRLVLVNSFVIYLVYLAKKVKLTHLCLISGFHRALLQSITFISRLMHSVIQNLEAKIYVV